MLLTSSLLALSLLFTSCYFNEAQAQQIAIPSKFISHVVDPADKRLSLHWKGENNKPYRSFSKLKTALKNNNKQLVFAMNGGIFQQDLTPLGLYIERGLILQPLSRRQQGYGNFYIQPNGVFYLTKQGRANIVRTERFKLDQSIEYATQSGPMLLLNGDINPAFNPDSTSLRVRNGVGLLDDGRVVFILSKGFVNFYDFANYFHNLGCNTALYLDGSISRFYLPERGVTMDGEFGVIIAEIENGD